jgi:hypothetical protein
MTIPLSDHLWRPIPGVEEAEGDLISNSLPAASQVGNIGLQKRMPGNFNSSPGYTVKTVNYIPIIPDGDGKMANLFYSVV